MAEDVPPSPREGRRTQESALTAVASDRTLEDRVRFTRSDMLRGTRAAEVLRSFGRVFANSEGSASTFKLSAQVEGIDYFISHNWSTRRLDKFLALALYFNARSAYVAMWVAALLTVPLNTLGVLPMLEVVPSQGTTIVSRESVFAQVVGFWVLLLALVFGHELRILLRCKGPVTFLDKTCIVQTDAELKREGIESLAAFLENSQKVLVVYSSTYLKKLWTVYELANFLLLHPERKIVVLPCFFPKMVLSVFCCYSMFLAVHRLLNLRSVNDLIQDVPGLGNVTSNVNLLILVILAFLFQLILEKWARECSEIKKVVQDFSIRNAVCRDESDRAVVQTNIASFMHCLGLVVAAKAEDEEAFESRALDAFDELVRAKVPPALASCLGRQTISYEQAVFMFSCQSVRGLEHLAPCFWGELPVRRSVLQLVENLTVGMALLPLVVAMFVFAALGNATSQSKSPVWRRLRALGKFTVICITGIGTWSALNIINKQAFEDNGWLAAFVLFVSAHLVLVALVYRPVREDKVASHVRKWKERPVSDWESVARTASSTSSSVVSI